MGKNVSDIIVVLVIALAFCFVGYCWGRHDGNLAAIDAGFAEFVIENSKTGSSKFRWKTELIQSSEINK